MGISNNCPRTANFILNDNRKRQGEVIHRNDAKRTHLDSGHDGDSEVNEIDSTVTPIPTSINPKCTPVNQINSMIQIRNHMPSLPTFDAMILASMPPLPHLWNRQLDTSILRHVALYQSSLFSTSVMQNPTVSPWLEHVPDSKDNGNYRLRCKWCNAFLANGNRRDRKGYKQPSALMTPGGMLHDKKQANDNELLTHASNDVHLDALDYAKECAGQGDARKTSLSTIRKSYPPQERYWIPEINLFKMAVDHIQSNTAIARWPQRTRNLRGIDANIGYIHHTTEGLKKIMTSIAPYEKSKLFMEINKGNPLTVMVDTYQVRDSNVFVTFLSHY